jgi:hypothetical protein
LVSNWRENNKNMKHLEYNRFRKTLIVKWYIDLFRPSGNDTWLEKLTFYETLLCQIYEHEEADPERAAFYRQDLTQVTLNSTLEDISQSKDSYQKRVDLIFGNLRRNLTSAVTKTLMVNNVLRVDSVVRKLNPVVMKVIIGRLFGEVRASEKEIEQHKRVLAKQHSAIVSYRKFVSSLGNYAKTFDIPLPVAEWDELLAVQAEFDNITNLSYETWIVPKLTKHNWGRELLAAREVLHDSAASGSNLSPSFINKAAKWTTMRVADLNNAVVGANWVIKRGYQPLVDGIIMFLYLVVRKIMK